MKNKKKRKLKIGYICALAVIVIILGLGLYLILPISGASKYGDALDGIDKISFSEKAKNKVINNLKKNENVTSAKMDVKGRIIYIMYNVKKDVSKDDAKKIGDESLNDFSDDVKGFYEIEYIITKKNEEGTKEKITNSDGEEEEVVKKEFPAIGAKNTKSASIVWSR